VKIPRKLKQKIAREVIDSFGLTISSDPVEHLAYSQAEKIARKAARKALREWASR
jgi:hypothetical protein